MAVSLSIKDVPDDLAEALRKRAAMNHRSIQGELMHILESAVRPRRFPIEQLWAELQKVGLEPSGDSSAALVREDRDTR